MSLTIAWKSPPSTSHSFSTVSTFTFSMIGEQKGKERQSPKRERCPGYSLTFQIRVWFPPKRRKGWKMRREKSDQKGRDKIEWVLSVDCLLDLKRKERFTPSFPCERRWSSQMAAQESRSSSPTEPDWWSDGAMPERRARTERVSRTLRRERALLLPLHWGHVEGGRRRGREERRARAFTHWHAWAVQRWQTHTYPCNPVFKVHLHGRAYQRKTVFFSYQL